MISENKNFIYCHIPKCAGSSVQEILLPYANFSKKDYEHNDKGLIKFVDKYGIRKHTMMLKIRRLLGRNKFNSMYRFATIRNPYDRFVSAYWWSLKYRWCLTERKYRQLSKDKIDYDYAKLIISMNIWRTQFRYLQVCGKPAIHYAIRMENLQEGIDHVCKVLNIPRQQIGRLNSNELHKNNYRYYYDDKLKKLVENKYKIDLETWEYEF